MKGSFRRIVVLLTAVSTLVSPPASAVPADDSKVYGEPGEGRIRLGTVGGGARWVHPGVYWLPKGTTLLDFTKLAAPRDLPGGEMPGDTWIYVRQADKIRERSLLRRIRPGTAAAAFALEDGDVLQTNASF